MSPADVETLRAERCSGDRRVSDDFRGKEEQKNEMGGGAY